MDTTFEVAPRSSVRKGAARKARAKGEAPGVVYGSGQAARPVTFDPAALAELFKQSGDRNTILDLKVGGAAPVKALVREVQRHPVSRVILHVDFYEVPTTPVTVRVPLVPTGRPKGAVIGGRVRMVRRDLVVAATADRIPRQIEVDVTALDVGDSMSVSQVVAPEGVSIVFDQDFKVVQLEGKAAKEVEEPKAATPAAAAAPAAKPGEKK